MGKKTATADVVNVTPAQAKKWLEGNTNNRPIYQRVVGRLVNEMREGRWMVNGSTISFTSEGRLLDGQHRLTALIEYGKPLKMLVAKNIEDEAFKSIDTGLKRTTAQIFGLGGVQNSAVSASIARWIYMIQNSGKEPVQMSSEGLMEIYNDHPLIAKYATTHHQPTIKSLLPSGAQAVSVLAAEKYGEEIPDMFMYQFATGEDMKKGSPVYELRERLIRNQAATTKLTPTAKVAMTMKAMKAFAKGTQIHQLRYGLEEDWPTI